MSKAAPKPNVKQIIASMLDTLDGQKSYIAGEMLKYATSKKTFPKASDKVFMDGMNSLLDADPRLKQNEGKPVISLKATELDQEKQIAKLEGDGVDKELLEPVRKKMRDTRTTLTENLASDAGIKKLICEKVTTTHLAAAPKQSFWTKAQDGSAGFLPSAQGDQLTALVKKNVDMIRLPEAVVDSLLRAKNPEQPTKEIQAFQQLISQIAVQNFSTGKKHKLGGLELAEIDPDKLNNKDQQAKFERDITTVFDIATSVITQLENQGTKLSETNPAKIAKQATRMVVALGESYVRLNKDKIVEEMAEATKGRKRLLSSSIGHEAFEEITDKIIAHHTKAAGDHRVKLAQEAQIPVAPPLPQDMEKIPQQPKISRPKSAAQLDDKQQALLQELASKVMAGKAGLKKVTAQADKSNDNPKKFSRPALKTTGRTLTR